MSASDVHAASPLPLPLPRGAVLLYDTALWHRGGANRAKGKTPKERPIYYITVLSEHGDPPAGLPFTIEPHEAACFGLAAEGPRTLTEERCLDATS